MADSPHSLAMDVADFIIQISPLTHSGTATVLASRLERPLTWIIQANMPNLSNRMKAKLFDGTGPLSTFSAKIDVAYALGYIDADLKRALHAIREIRNEFAHADDDLHFNHPTILALVKKLPNAHTQKDPFGAFVDICSACAARLERLHPHHELIKALTSGVPTKTSPGKSA